MEKKFKKIHLTYYNLLIAQDLRQALYKTLSIIFLKVFIKLNVITDINIRKVKLVKFLKYINFKDDLIEYKYLCCNKNYQQKFDEKLMENFLNKYKFSNHDNIKFILLLQKGVYPYEYIEQDWEKFNEISLLEKEDFYSHLNREDITDGDYVHPKTVCKEFEIKHLGEYHDLYLQRDTLLLAAVFENFKNMFFNPAKFLSVPGLAWQADLKALSNSKIGSFN